MAVPRAISAVEKLRDYRLLCKSGEGKGSNKFFARRGDDDLHLGPFFYEKTNKRSTLIGRNAARNAQNNMLTLKAHKRLDGGV